jgi:hypothetical protein
MRKGVKRIILYNKLEIYRKFIVIIHKNIKQ